MLLLHTKLCYKLVALNQTLLQSPIAKGMDPVMSEEFEPLLQSIYHVLLV